MSNVWTIFQEKRGITKDLLKKAPTCFCFPVKDNKIPDISYKIQKILRTTWPSIITHKDLLHLIIWMKTTPWTKSKLLKPFCRCNCGRPCGCLCVCLCGCLHICLCGCLCCCCHRCCHHCCHHHHDHLPIPRERWDDLDIPLTISTFSIFNPPTQ